MSGWYQDQVSKLHSIPNQWVQGTSCPRLLSINLSRHYPPMSLLIKRTKRSWYVMWWCQTESCTMSTVTSFYPQMATDTPAARWRSNVAKGISEPNIWHDYVGDLPPLECVQTHYVKVRSSPVFYTMLYQGTTYFLYRHNPTCLQ